MINGKGHVGALGNLNQGQVFFVSDLAQTGTQRLQAAFLVNLVSSFLFAAPRLDDFLLRILFVDKQFLQRAVQKFGNAHQLFLIDAAIAFFDFGDGRKADSQMIRQFLHGTAAQSSKHSYLVRENNFFHSMFILLL